MPPPTSLSSEDEALVCSDCEGEEEDDYYDENDLGFYYEKGPATEWPLKSGVVASFVPPTITAATRASPRPRVRINRSQDVLKAAASIATSEESTSPITPVLVTSITGSKESIQSASFPGTHRLAPTYKAFPNYSRLGSQASLAERAFHVNDIESPTEPLLPKTYLLTENDPFTQDERNAHAADFRHIRPNVEKNMSRKKGFPTMALRRSFRSLINKVTRQARMTIQLDERTAPLGGESGSDAKSIHARPATSAGITNTWFSLEPPLPPNRPASRSITNVSMIAVPRSSSVANPPPQAHVSEKSKLGSRKSMRTNVSASNPNLAIKDAYQVKMPMEFGPIPLSQTSQQMVEPAARRQQDANVALVSLGAEVMTVPGRRRPTNLPTSSNATAGTLRVESQTPSV